MAAKLQIGVASLCCDQIAILHHFSGHLLKLMKRTPPAWRSGLYNCQSRDFSYGLSRYGDFSPKNGAQKEDSSLKHEDESSIVLSGLHKGRSEAKNFKERMLVLQPDFKWGRGRFLSKTVQHRVDEAESLVQSISNWEVHEKLIESLHDVNSKHFFGTGKLKILQHKIVGLKKMNYISAVFINTGKLSKTQTNILENTFGCRVYDRYRIVLEIFKERARTKEAKLQVKMAELQYLKWHLSSDHDNFDQQRGGTMAIGGGGETYLELKKRLISDKEAKVRKELHQIETQRIQNKAERINRDIPQIALIGYTNAGKTTLAKAISGDEKMEPEDRLFATLDTTAHRGKLPCGVKFVCIDTVGFITDLPHELIKSFSSTLKDVKDATLLVHVRDIAHPERELQKKSVLTVLEKLDVRKELMENMIEVQNKEDKWCFAENELVKNIAEEERSEMIVSVSALKGTGINDLMLLIEEKILDVTEKKIFSLELSQNGPHFSWLHQHSTILKTTVVHGDKLEVQAIMDTATHAKFQKFLKEQ